MYARYIYVFALYRPAFVASVTVSAQCYDLRVNQFWSPPCGPNAFYAFTYMFPDPLWLIAVKSRNSNLRVVDDSITEVAVAYGMEAHTSTSTSDGDPENNSPKAEFLARWTLQVDIDGNSVILFQLPADSMPRYHVPTYDQNSPR